MPSSRQVVTSPDAPAAVGPYSHAVRTGDLLFCSGQVALDPATGELVGDTVADQTRQVMKNLTAVCAAAGADLARAVRCTIYLTDMSTFGEVGEIYAESFSAEPPARVTVGVAELPKGALVEVDAVIAL